MSASFTVHAGARAAAHVRGEGLKPADIACIPAAAGGPKGLALIPLDQRLFGGWLLKAPHVELVGASIGAWRMFAAAQTDPVAALARLAESYIQQRYPRKPTPADVSDECRKLARAVLGGERMPRLRGNAGVSLITARARGVLDRNGSRAALARAALANARSRHALAAHLQRVVFHAGAARFPAQRFDAFGLERVPLAPDNCEDALLASGSIPLVCEPVRDPAGAARGHYWDGGLIDYHLLLPYHTLGGIVLYPHFVPYVTAGWLDKFLPWRKRSRAHPWLANVLLIAPSREFLARLPGGTAARAPGLLPLRAGPRRAHARLAARHRRMRTLCRRCDGLARAARPGANGAALNRAPVPTLGARWGMVMRAWLAFVARPRPDLEAPAGAGSRLTVIALLLASATPLALAAAVLVAPLAERFEVQSRLDFRFSVFEAALVLAIAPAIEELVFRWPLKSRRTFERGVVLLPLAALALFAIARAATAASGAWIRLPAIALAAAATPIALFALDDALERHRFTTTERTRTLFARRYPLLAHGATLAFALTHALNYPFGAATLALLPLLVLPQGILGYACLYARLVYGLPAAIGLHMAHNAIAYGLVALGL